MQELGSDFRQMASQNVTKKCIKCQQELPRAGYETVQWELPRNRKCRNCKLGPTARECVLFIGTKFSILYTSMYSPAEAATQPVAAATGTHPPTPVEQHGALGGQSAAAAEDAASAGAGGNFVAAFPLGAFVFRNLARPGTLSDGSPALGGGRAPPQDALRTGLPTSVGQTTPGGCGAKSTGKAGWSFVACSPPPPVLRAGGVSGNLTSVPLLPFGAFSAGSPVPALKDTTAVIQIFTRHMFLRYLFPWRPVVIWRDVVLQTQPLFWGLCVSLSRWLFRI